jgi:hypothetical protein
MNTRNVKLAQRRKSCMHVKWCREAVYGLVMWMSGKRREAKAITETDAALRTQIGLGRLYFGIEHCRRCVGD